MVDLDDIQTIKRYDSSDMLELIESFPEQSRNAKAIGDGVKVPERYRVGYKNIVFLGVGGSAIGADLIRSYVAGEALVPIFINRNYTVPNFVDGSSLVIASSYSGDTEETLSAYEDAKRRRAAIVAMTSGGRLQNLAESDGIPLIIIPKGLPPRCALGYSFFPPLVFLSKLGLVGDKSKNIDDAIALLKKLKDETIGRGVPASKNLAKKIAKAIYTKYPIIYAGQDHMDSVVTRWRGQLAENSKTLSSSHLFPEMNHNEIVGWENPRRLFEALAVIMLRDSGDHDRTSRRMDITKKMIGDEGVRIIEVRSLGKDLLSRIFSLIYIGDYVSFYLAILNKRDPTPVERVAYLKKKLAKV